MLALEATLTQDFIRIIKKKKKLPVTSAPLGDTAVL